MQTIIYLNTSSFSHLSLCYFLIKISEQRQQSKEINQQTTQQQKDAYQSTCVGTNIATIHQRIYNSPDEIPLHPLALQNKYPNNILIKLLKYFFYTIYLIFLVPLKCFFLFGILFAANLCAIMDNAFTDPKYPLPKGNRVLYKLGDMMLARCLALAFGLVIIQRGRKNRNYNANIKVFNHVNFIDSCTCAIDYGGSSIVNSGMAELYFLRAILVLSRAIVVSRPLKADASETEKRKRAEIEKQFGVDNKRSVTQVMQQRVNQMNNHEQNWDCLLIFPEGTICNQQNILKFHTSAFALDNCLVQPCALKYRTIVNMEWLTNSGKNALFKALLNPFGVITIDYLPCVQRNKNETPRQFADRVGNMIADKLKCKYTQYTNYDMGYFIGWKQKQDCSQQYLEDFQILGNFQEFRQKMNFKKSYQLQQKDIVKYIIQEQKKNK